MPQISQLGESGYLLTQLFWIVLTFGAAYFLIGRGMVPKVRGTMDDRDARVAADIKAAEAARAEADAAEERWRAAENAAREAARAKLAEARGRATGVAEKLVAAGDAAQAEQIAAAEARIADASAAATAELEAVVGEAARDIVTRIAGLSVDETTARSAAKAALNG